MERIDTIIFDLDGTLINTLEDLTDSVNHAMTIFGYQRRTIDEVRSFVGNGVARLVTLSIPDREKNPDYEGCLNAFLQHYEGNLRNKTRPYDGIIETLRQLRSENYKTAVVSNKFAAGVKALCQDFFGDLIQVAVGESATIKKKPAPDAVFEALGVLGTSVGQAVYVGDSDVDVDTAKNAGLPFVGVTWGFRDRRVLEEKGARFIIDAPQALTAILKTINTQRDNAD